MKNRQQSQSAMMHQESFAEHRNIGVLDSASTLLPSVASGDRMDATNENVFKIISACNVRLDGGALATFWTRLA